MAEIRNLTRNGETFYPLTTSSAVINEATGEGLVIDDVPTPKSDNLAKSGGTYDFIKENTLEEKEHPIADNDVAGYLTDKNKSVLAKLFMDGSLEWIVKNERDKNIDEVIQRVDTINLEVPNVETDNIHYLTDKDGVVIATINNVGETKFKGGGGFDGEITTSKNILFDAIKVITDNNNTVIGWITSGGKVHFEELDVTKLSVKNSSDIGIPSQLFPVLGLIAGGTENHKFVNDRAYNLFFSTKGEYRKDGVSITTDPVITIQDDDAEDCQLPQSYVYEATEEQEPSSSYRYRGGFASLLFPVLKALNVKHASTINGKITCGVASEGQRIGLTPLYGMQDTFDGNLNTCGKIIKSLVENEGWECLIHSMTARYITNSYLVNGLDSEFAQSLLVDATYDGANGLRYNTTTCYDTVTKKNYKVKQDKSGWDECPVHYAKPYIALTKASDSPLIINPTYSFKYQVKTWKDRADIAHLPYINIAVTWGGSHGSRHICEDMKYVDALLAVGGVTSVNNIPFRVCPNRNPLTVNASSNGITEHTYNYNVYNKKDYEKIKSIINSCIETGGWSILRGHAYESKYYNNYVSYFSELYGADSADCGPLCYKDDNYPSEWVLPLNYSELMDMIGDNTHDYFNNPPARLNISSWGDWYPCPGTTMAMIYDLLEYAISQGVRFDTAENILKERGNLFAIGCETVDTLAPDKRLPENETVKSFCRIGADGSIVYYNK